MPFDCVQIFFAGMRQRAQQLNEVAAGEGFGADGDDLADRFATSFYYERLVSISDAVHDF